MHISLKFAIVIVGLFILTTCQNTHLIKDVPSCIQNTIKIIKSEKVHNPPASIWQYDYYGQTVYFIPQHCCDFPSQLFDSNCNVLCYPDGGLSGHGDGKCIDFHDLRKNEKLVWQDDRN